MVHYRDPPQFKPQIFQVHRFRFISSAQSGNDIAITDAFLSRLLLSVINGSANATELMASFKIIQLEEWFPTVGPQGSVTLLDSQGPAITWLGGGLASDRVVASNSLSGDRPGYLSTRPPKNSQASWWGLGAGNSNTYFSINSSVLGAIIDLTMAVEINLGVGNVTTLAANSSVTGTLLGRLDGSAGIWVAVSGGIVTSIE